MIHFPELAADPAADGFTAACAAPGSAAPRELEAGVEGLAEQLGRLRLKLSGAPSAPSDVRGSLLDRLEECARLLGDIDAGAEELRQRLTRSESLIHEQGLQLQARSQESQTDSLTGLANRRNFERRFEQQCCAARAAACPLVVAILDIDHFKAINDTRGHQVGDAVLRGLARAISGQLPPGAVAARFGGEEFALLFPGMPLERALEAVEQIRALVERAQFRYEGRDVAVTISGGLARWTPGEHGQNLLQRADLALYASKQAGRNRTSWHDGRDIHQATGSGGAAAASGPDDAPRLVLDLTARDDSPEPSDWAQSASLLMPRSMRACWCDASTLFWYLRQRLTEWKRGGEPCCALALDVDHASRITQLYGPVALHFMMRVQMLHFDAVFREMDVIARTCQSRVVVVLPRLTVAGLAPVLQRLRETMDRFAYPTATGALEYSISLGAADVAPQDDAPQFVERAEAALAAAQSAGTSRFFALGEQGAWDLDAAPALPS